MRAGQLLAGGADRGEEQRPVPHEGRAGHQGLRPPIRVPGGGREGPGRQAGVLAGGRQGRPRAGGQHVGRACGWGERGLWPRQGGSWSQQMRVVFAALRALSYPTCKLTPLPMPTPCRRRWLSPPHAAGRAYAVRGHARPAVEGGREAGVEDGVHWKGAGQGAD